MPLNRRHFWQRICLPTKSHTKCFWHYLLSSSSVFYYSLVKEANILTWKNISSRMIAWGPPWFAWRKVEFRQRCSKDCDAESAYWNSECSSRGYNFQISKAAAETLLFANRTLVRNKFLLIYGLDAYARSHTFESCSESNAFYHDSPSISTL